MSAHQRAADLPRPLLWSAGLLVLLALALAALGEDAGAVRIDASTAIVSSHDVRLHSRPDGAVVPILLDGTPLETIEADKVGFVSGVIRGLARGRKLSNIDPNAPYRISRLRDGRLLLTDTFTATSINLDVFGSDNARTFANIWEQGEARALSNAR